MAILRQQNWLSQQRVDVPHLRSLESAVAADFDVAAGRILSGGQAVVVRGFALTNIGTNVLATSLQLSTADGVVCNLQASEAGTFLWVPADRAAEVLNPTTNSRVSGSWTSGQVNYVGVDLVRTADTATTDLVQFLDAETLLETPKQVPLARTLDYRIVIGTVPFSSQPNLVPVAVVTLNSSGQVTAASDARPLLFRLGSGGDNPSASFSYPWPEGRKESTALSAALFTGGDKAVKSQRDWMQAVMTRLWELGGGEYWYGATADRNVNLVWTGATFANGENFTWDGTHLLWKGVRFLFDNSTGHFNDVERREGNNPGQTDLADGECLYVDLDRSKNTANQWVTGRSTEVGEAVYNSGKVYTATTAGTTGATPPTHTTGSVSDGGVTWKYVSGHSGDGTAPAALAPAPVKTALTTMGAGSPPGSRQVLAWRVGDKVFTRQWRYAVGTTFVPATTTSLGVVMLNQTPASASQPKVVSIMADDRIQVTATANNATAATFTGHGTGKGVSGTGGGSSGDGLHGIGGGPNGVGVRGSGTGTGPGMVATGSAAGSRGVHAAGTGSEAGVYAIGGPTGGKSVLATDSTGTAVTALNGNSSAGKGEIGTTTNHPLRVLTNNIEVWEFTTAGVLQAVGSNRKIANVLDPTANQDAATKFYVDRRNNPRGIQNAVINGRFDFWQRATGVTSFSVGTTRTYTADRWAAIRDANSFTVERVAIDAISGSETSRYGLRMTRPNGENATDTMRVSQELDRDEVRRLRGKSLTFQFKYRITGGAQGTLFAAKFHEGNGAESQNYLTPYTGASSSTQNLSPTTSWQTAQFSVSVALTTTTIALEFLWTPSGTADVAETFDVAEVMLVERTFGTPVENFNWYGGSRDADLTACQRYYAKTFNVDSGIGQNQGLAGAVRHMVAVAGAVTTSWNGASWRFPVRMRATPTITFYNPSAANAFVRNITAGTDATATTATSVSESGTFINATGLAGWAAGDDSAVHATADAEI